MINTIFESITQTLKKTWDVTKSIVTLKAAAKTLLSSLILSIVNKKSIAEGFHNFFVNTGCNLASKIPKAKQPFNKYLKQNVKLS